MQKIRCLFLLILLFSQSSFAQNYTAIEALIQEKYQDHNSNKEEYIFIKDKANFEKLESQIVKQYFPNYELYAVDMTFKLRPDWRCRCVIFFDSMKRAMILQEPLSMNGINPKLIDLIKQITFNDSASLTSFINELHLIRQVGSKYKFVETSNNDTLITYDLVYFADQDYITKPYRNTTKNRYESTEIMGKIVVRKEKNKIIDYWESSSRSKQ